MFLDRAPEGFGNSAHLAGAVNGGEDEVIGEMAILGDIQDLNVAGMFVLENFCAESGNSYRFDGFGPRSYKTLSAAAVGRTG